MANSNIQTAQFNLAEILANLKDHTNPPLAGNLTGTNGAQVPSTSPSIEDRLNDQLRHSSAKPPAKPAPINPATITTWKDGLRCVSKIAEQNKNFEGTIKKMIEDQRKTEMRWYSERQAFKQDLSTRGSSMAQARSILQKLGTAPAGNGSPQESKEDQDAALERYDQKIYELQSTMQEHMESQLKSLGVPYFGTDRSLIVPDGYDAGSKQLPASHPQWSPLIGESELRELRKKMIEHLEDRYRD